MEATNGSVICLSTRLEAFTSDRSSISVGLNIPDILNGNAVNNRDSLYTVAVASLPYPRSILHFTCTSKVPSFLRRPQS